MERVVRDRGEALLLRQRAERQAHVPVAAQRILEGREPSGEPVDADILALLTDMEQVGLTNTEAYVALDAYRPGSAVGATGGEDEAVSEA